MGSTRPCAWIEKDGDGATAVAVSYVPSLPADPRPAEVIFLVDESGSMQGSSIEQVRNALQLCLRSMIPGCRFNIVSFGSNFEALFPESRPYDETSLAAASAFVVEHDRRSRRHRDPSGARERADAEAMPQSCRGRWSC